MDSVCHLCRTAAALCRSHIIPEFLYRPLYDDKHRYFILTKDTPDHRYEQQGLREYLLCRECEQRFGRYEKYAAEVMTGQLGHQFRRAGTRIVIENIEYRRFRLFQLSILWRASVSSLEFFRLVKLGPLQERLREMLLREHPGDPHEFGCVVVFATERGTDVSDTMFNPELLRWSGRRVTKFFFASSAWLFHCDTRPAPAYLQTLFLQMDGTLRGLTGDLAEARMYGTSAKRMARQMGF